MNKDQFVDILMTPDDAGKDSVVNLEELIRQYPYFQTARLLHLKLLKNQESIHFRKNLKTTSAYATDRTKLYHFVNGGDLKQMQESARMGQDGYGTIAESTEVDIHVPTVANDERVLLEDSKIAAEQPLVDDASVVVEDSVSPPESAEEIIESSEAIEKNINQNWQAPASVNGMSPQEILEKRLQEIRETGSAVSKEPSTKETSPADESNETEQNEIATNEIDSLPDNGFTDDNIQSSDLPTMEPRIVDEENENIDVELSTSVIDDHVPVFEEKQAVVDNVKVPIEDSEIDPEASDDDENQMSFGRWLRRMQPIIGSTDPGLISRVHAPQNVFIQADGQTPGSSQTEIIDHFIKNNPRIERKKAEFYSAQDMARKSIVDKEELVSETLANIYANQGFREKAIAAFEKLSLKYPQKSAYFAARIQSIKDSGSIK